MVIVLIIILLFRLMHITNLRCGKPLIVMLIHIAMNIGP